MPVNYSASVINSRLQVVLSAIDAGGAGTLNLLNSSGGTLVSFTLANPAGTISSGVLTFSGLSLIASVAQSGTATGANIEDASSNIVVSGLTVNSATPDIILSPTSAMVAGQTVAIIQATITGN